MENFSLNFSGRKYNAVLTNELISDKSGMNRGYLFNIYHGNNLIACLTIFITHFTLTVWKSTSSFEINQGKIENLIKILATHINFPFDLGNDIKKEEQAKVDGKVSLYTLYISNIERGFELKNNTLSLNCRDRIDEFLHAILFGEEIDDLKIERELLEILLHERKKDFEKPVSLDHIAELFMLEKKVVYAAADLLEQNHLIDVEKISGGRWDVKITGSGVRYIQNINREREIATSDLKMGQPGQGGAVNIYAMQFTNTGKITADGGSNYQNSPHTENTSQEKNSPIQSNVGNNSQNTINNNDIDNALNTIKSQLSEHIEPVNREVVNSLLEELQEELKKEEKDPGKITVIFSSLKKISIWVVGKIIEGAAGAIIIHFIPPVLLQGLPTNLGTQIA
jgi:hypothetical protein